MADIFLYGGAANLNDIILRDPSTLAVIAASGTILTDRRGAGGYSRKQHDEFVKAKHAAQARARKLKKEPAEELREAVAIASQAVSLLGDFSPSLAPVTEALMEAATADAAHAMQTAVNAVNAARLLLERIEEDEDDVMLLLSI